MAMVVGKVESRNGDILSAGVARDFMAKKYTVSAKVH